MKSLSNFYDAIVIGSGPGGAVSYSELIMNGFNACLLDSGDDYRDANIEEFSIEELINKYKHQGMTSTLGIPPINYAEGHCFGGGSEVNSGLYHQTPRIFVNRLATKVKYKRGLIMR